MEKLPKSLLAAAWAVALAAIAPMLDMNMMNMAVQSMTKDFHTTLNILQWGITGYTLALAMIIPFSSFLLNHFDGKKVMVISTLVFALTSFFITLSNSVQMFIGLRVIQGIGAGIITALMKTLIVKIAGHDNVGRVIGIVTTPMMLGPIFGPILGGVIVQNWTWRWLFDINIFISIIVVLLMMKYVPAFAAFNEDESFDLFGSLLLAGLIASLLYGLSEQSLLWAAVGVFTTAIYIIYDTMRKHKSVLPLNLFKYTQFAASNAGSFLYNATVMGPMFILPLYFQEGRNFTAIEASLALLPQGIAMLITRPLLGKWLHILGSKKLLRISIFGLLVTTLPLVFINESTNILIVGTILFLRGLTFGSIKVPFSAEMYNGLPHQYLAEAGVAGNMLEQFGSGFGTALIATVVSALISNHTGNTMYAFQIGFFVSCLGTLLMFVPTFFLVKHAD
ncbi:DHA2 family efflux MFS transporter permease subunit [Oenococcus sicerae]|uniref:DHA2 family efflux MFS transporter permease subunit n=1 Tax=Oenococcus sicerae TaxID=2203724 RepID=A0AAJ1RB79_9LACO|nr:DHA2 family efflux MFS transporter permease subunit [Oenococcus sicerae]MDN6900590.1 DHA2 family efflux MFS transporter permease subunit [Oenococcus sicerae]